MELQKFEFIKVWFTRRQRERETRFLQVHMLSKYTNTSAYEAVKSRQYEYDQFCVHVWALDLLKAEYTDTTRANQLMKINSVYVASWCESNFHLVCLNISCEWWIGSWLSASWGQLTATEQRIIRCHWKFLKTFRLATIVPDSIRRMIFVHHTSTRSDPIKVPIGSGVVGIHPC